jgi:hypothetical protein
MREEDTEEEVMITEEMRDVHVSVITIRKKKARVRVEVEVMTKKKDTTERKVVNLEVTDYSNKELND